MMSHSVTSQTLIAGIILACLISGSSTTWGQTQIHLKEGEIRCFEKTVLLSQLSRITSRDARVLKSFNDMDIDAFDDQQERIFVTKEQIRIRLRLAGFNENQFELSGPDLLTVVAASQENGRDSILGILTQQLADQFNLSIRDIKVTLGAGFKNESLPGNDYSTLQVDNGFQTELPLGRVKLPVMMDNHSGQSAAFEIPVSIAIVRNLVRAKTNISVGQPLTADNIESVRRPIANRNVRFVSYEQAIGTSAQSDLQQFELIKSSSVRKTTLRSGFLIKKNTIVDVVVRRGSLSVRMTGARALGNGNEGDRIVLENLTTEKKILGTIINASTVEVRY